MRHRHNLSIIKSQRALESGAFAGCATNTCHKHDDHAIDSSHTRDELDRSYQPS